LDDKRNVENGESGCKWYFLSFAYQNTLIAKNSRGYNSGEKSIRFTKSWP